MRQVAVTVVALALVSLGAMGCATKGANPCERPCDTPPRNYCEGRTAHVYDLTGTCTSDGDARQCQYRQVTIECGASFCSGGRCIPNACEPNPCAAPPSDTCVGDLAHRFPFVGICTSDASGEAVCDYPANIVDCAQTGQICDGGQCITPFDPCSPNPCRSPPIDFCTGDIATTHDATGTCTDGGGVPVCDYDPQPTDCAAGGGYCLGGACVADPCSPNPCDTPPADSCLGKQALQYAATGVCTDLGGVARCDYGPTIVDCAQTNERCELGVCVTDVCSPNPCITPPGDFCTGDVANIHDDPGVCTDVGGSPQCDYGPRTVDCQTSGFVCVAGACYDDPCSPNPCDSPPPDGCNSGVAENYPSTGTCSDVGGSPQCTYTPSTVDCAAAGQLCVAASCLPNLIISEYVEGSSWEKFIEIYNPSAAPVELAGYIVEVYFNGATTPSGPITLNAFSLPSKGTFVISHTSASIYTADQMSGNLDFNGNDAIILRHPTGQQLDVVGVVGSATNFGQDRTFIRNAGITSGVTSGDWVFSEWTELPAIDDQQLGSHTE